MALAITAFGFSSADAQVCYAKKKVVKKKVVAARKTAPVRTALVQAEECRVVPNEVCSINPDRRSLTCYKTTDDENLTPMNSQILSYGPTGALPGTAPQPNVETVVIKGQPKAASCKRDLTNTATVCSYPNRFRLVRDAEGFYHYQEMLQSNEVVQGVTPATPVDNGISMR